jgi:hypothetical protein
LRHREQVVALERVCCLPDCLVVQPGSVRGYRRTRLGWAVDTIGRSLWTWARAEVDVVEQARRCIATGLISEMPPAVTRLEQEADERPRSVRPSAVHRVTGSDLRHESIVGHRDDAEHRPLQPPRLVGGHDQRAAQSRARQVGAMQHGELAHVGLERVFAEHGQTSMRKPCRSSRLILPFSSAHQSPLR